MNPNGSGRRVRERRTWESGEEGDAMGGVVDLTLVPARGGDGAAAAALVQGELCLRPGRVGCEMRESGDLGLLLS